MIFKNRTEYQAAYRWAVENCNNIPGLAVLVRSTKNILDFDFYVDLFTGLVDQIDMVYSPLNNRFPIIRAAILTGFIMGRTYGMTIPEDIPESYKPRRSRRPSHKKAQKQPAKKDGKANEE